MNTAHDAVILAAGGSRRLGRPKQLLTAGGEALVARVVRLVLATQPARTLVIVGAYGEAISVALSGYDVEIITNDAWATGMASSLRKAASELTGRHRPTLITVVDQPALEGRHLTALLAGHTHERDSVTAYGEACGVPVVLRASTLARADGLNGEMGFRQLLAASEPRVVRADDLADDLDDEADLARAVAGGLVDPP